MLNKFNFQIASLIDSDAMGPMAGLLVSPDSTMETDGHQFVMVTAPEAQPSLFPADDEITEADYFTPFVLDKASALKLAKIMPSPKEGNPREMAVIDISTETDGTATLAVNDDERRTIVKSEKITGTFPSLMRVTPAVDKARFEISFSSEVLVPVLKAFQGFSGALTIRIYTALQGVRIDAQADGQKMTAVVMPLRQVEDVVEKEDHADAEQTPIEESLCGEALEEHEERANGPALAPATTMGGTHQRKRKCQEGRW